ncbi:PTS mannose transporter subunit IID [Enterovibrio norvegicus FF-33]|uniref:phosphoenolpyruvate--glycerone phosphotransferase n=1 Tax=Enterovibrio norvegicus FF-454 TaxID=1185651 RepID=A0A1E5CD07_9GAMM|nr:PTS mannose transporter subunit IID [Enterovibrio norvegicus FF-454]OEE69997.1 PTS mannose transporter subunit IID [Enterovibrio norvegicus FF-33]OEE76188.1 PTS mannose transporter subunit IID [Enterovibrio norvegicus FF-162]
MNNPISLVIVSHSRLVAQGVADMATQIVTDAVPIAWTGGASDGQLGCNADAIYDAITSVWSPAGVAIFVDMGSTELNSEVAIDMLSPEKAKVVRIIDAPLVEGVIVASYKAVAGGSLKQVELAANELNHAGG